MEILKLFVSLIHSSINKLFWCYAKIKETQKIYIHNCGNPQLQLINKEKMDSNFGFPASSKKDFSLI